MTVEEAREFLGKTVAIEAPGIACGFKYVKIVSYDENERCSWGRGTVLYSERPAGSRILRTKACFTQTNIYYNGSKEASVKRKRNKKNV